MFRMDIDDGPNDKSDDMSDDGLGGVQDGFTLWLNGGERGKPRQGTWADTAGDDGDFEADLCKLWPVASQAELNKECNMFLHDDAPASPGAVGRDVADGVGSGHDELIKADVNKGLHGLVQSLLDAAVVAGMHGDDKGVEDKACKQFVGGGLAVIFGSSYG